MMKDWEKKVLAAPGAADRVAEIEDELRRARSSHPWAGRWARASTISQWRGRWDEVAGRTVVPARDRLS